jgi:hypothetical protein
MVAQAERAKASTSPVGYYRLGQSYPRTVARQAYPSHRRRWPLLFPAGPAGPVAGPYRVAAGDVCVSGAVSGQLFVTGAVAGQVFVPSAVAGQIAA